MRFHSHHQEESQSLHYLVHLRYVNSLTVLGVLTVL